MSTVPFDSPHDPGMTTHLTRDLAVPGLTVPETTLIIPEVTVTTGEVNGQIVDTYGWGLPALPPSTRDFLDRLIEGL